jgi:hypothetical protein
MTMLRFLAAAPLATILAGCISFSSSEAPPSPDLTAFCQDKESQCRAGCGEAGVQHFSCKAAPSEGLEYRCECRKPGSRT